MKRTRKLRTAPGDLFILSVTTPDDVFLGWAVCVLKQDDPNIQQADMLALRHFIHRPEAELAVGSILKYLKRQRKMISKLAYPSEVWEWNAMPQSGSKEIYWTILEGDELTAFRNDNYAIICEMEEWRPTNLVTDTIQLQPELAHLRNKVVRSLDNEEQNAHSPS